MFAFAWYNRHQRALLLGRDHAGIKPLYYLHTGQRLIFASQYDQILAHVWSHNLGVSPDALGLYLRLGYIPAPYALSAQTHMLEPGTWLEVTSQGEQRRGRHFEFPLHAVPDLHGMEANEAVDAAVTAAVKRQMISDVPIGTFLSGGIDSPLVAAKMQTASDLPIRAFTIGTNGDHLDESTDASIYARELGVDHRLVHISPDDALAMFDDVIAACGEPFADYSIFPTMLVSRLARQEVKVMLSGDGGDELFWGYAGRFGSVLQKAADFKHPQWWRSARWGAKKWLGLGNGYYNLRIPTLGDWYRAKHTRLQEGWLQAIFPDLPGWPVDFPLFDYQGWEPDQAAQWLRQNEFVGHLTMVLLKVDRASMYHSLEVRVPLLDREVIDVATRVDWRSCLDLSTSAGKLPLRHSLARHVQHQTHAKRGFSVPMGDWLRGPLRPLFEDAVLGRSDLLGYPINRAALTKMFQTHLNGQTDHAWGLWVLLSLALWEAKYWHPQALRTSTSI
jgi:asparagine synthase (glutamine-hydrolysing)